MFFDWDKISFDERKNIARRIGQFNPIAVARRNWDELSDREKTLIKEYMIQRFRQGSRVPGLKRVILDGPSAQLVNDTAETMRNSGYSWDDIPAITMLSNDIMDLYLRRKAYSQSQLDALSQEAIINKVIKKLNPNAKRKVKYYQGGYRWIDN